MNNEFRKGDPQTFYTRWKALLQRLEKTCPDGALHRTLLQLRKEIVTRKGNQTERVDGECWTTSEMPDRNAEYDRLIAHSKEFFWMAKDKESQRNSPLSPSDLQPQFKDEYIVQYYVKASLRERFKDRRKNKTKNSGIVNETDREWRAYVARKQHDRCNVKGFDRCYLAERNNADEQE
mmetsp:Transcript_5808/g.14130  ORF Transcript_5808/g.14130 Transcript_5808/m.14130 type:complete len:178 (-) Transcript_5808:38-571(-)